MKKILKYFISNDQFWSLIQKLFLAKITRVKNARAGVLYHRVLSRLPKPFQVVSGPFKGLVYDQINASGSAYIPKLLGTYESELHSIFNEVDFSHVEEIVDIGCAEGYYAAGILRLATGSRVIAYDIDLEARERCQVMMDQNQLSSRSEIRGVCQPHDLLNLPSNVKRFIISDCEGYEYQLFTPEVIQHLHQAYVLIELHQPIDHTDNLAMIEHFQKTHETRIIHSVSEIEKPRLYSNPYVQTMEEGSIVFAEYRPDWMVWLFATPKHLV